MPSAWRLLLRGSGRDRDDWLGLSRAVLFGGLPGAGRIFFGKGAMTVPRFRMGRGFGGAAFLAGPACVEVEIAFQNVCPRVESVVLAPAERGGIDSSQVGAFGRFAIADAEPKPFPDIVGGWKVGSREVKYARRGPHRKDGASCSFQWMKQEGQIAMKMISKALAGAAFLALAACGGQGDDAAADNVHDAYENQAEMVEDMAENTTNEVREDMLENRADMLEEKADAAEDAIDDADVNAAMMNGQ